MSDDLTKPLIEKKGVTFYPNVDVRESLDTNGVISYHEKPYALVGPNTISTSKNKSGKVDETRFGSSTTAKPLDPKLLRNIKKENQELKNKDEFRARYGDEAFKIEYGEDEFTRIYGSECDGDKPCCNDKCTLVGGKKTKRRKYTKNQSKRQGSRKSRRSKKRSKNNKK